MKKSLIALAVAGVVAAPAAMADTANVNIYGQLNYSVDFINNGKTVNGASARNISSNVSRIGFKGTEDLGNGLAVAWQIEEGITADNTVTRSARNTFAGLKSDSLGTVIAGIHDTPYKLATRGYDLFADSVADNRSIMGGASLHDARFGNVLAYISPAFSGVTIAVANVSGAETPVAASTKGDAWSFAALYDGGALKGSLAYQTVTVGTAATGTLAGGTLTAPANWMAASAGAAIGTLVNDKTTAWKIGGSYSMDAFTVNAVYEKLTFTRAGTDLVNEGNWYLAGKYNLTANDAIKLAYTVGGKNNNLSAVQVANTDAKQTSIGYDHTLSKRTSVYALYSKLSNGSAANYTFSQATSAANANGGIGSSPSVFSLGMKHAF